MEITPFGATMEALYSFKKSLTRIECNNDLVQCCL
jgi:hypothetical protein